MQQPSPEQALEIAESAARKAGDYLADASHQLKEVEFLDRDDVKIRADRESEELIRRLLGQASHWPIVGEESGGDESLPQSEHLYWIVDPLDGTFNYLRGASQTAVSIGLMKGKDPILGVVYEFPSKTLYSGISGKGLLIDGTTATPAWAHEIAQAALATGFPAGMDKSPEAMDQFIGRIQPFKKIRMIGSAALATAYVAAGIYDVYFESGTRLWDVGAGMALILAAGGDIRLTRSTTGKPFAYDLWAGKGSFFPENSIDA